MTRILVVDDEPMVGALVSQALGASEFETVVVTDIKSAEAELTRAGFDVLVCDINLDGESGVALIDHARVRQEHREKAQTERHCRNVAETSLQIASAWGIDDPDTLRDLRWGALLHDIGKIGIPDAVLRKPGPLSAEERRIVNTHPDLGTRLLGGFDFLVGATRVVRHHHERYDGTGYPDGLAGEEIPLLARIFAVADTVDVLIGGRVYQAAQTPEAVRAEIARSAGSHFDPAVAECFLNLEPVYQGVVA